MLTVRYTGIKKNKKVSTRKPIRFSTWTLSNRKKRSEVHVVKEIIVSGTEEDIEEIKKDLLYLGNVYKSIYGKEKYLAKRKEGDLIVTKIELSEKILGYTNGQ